MRRLGKAICASCGNTWASCKCNSTTPANAGATKQTLLTQKAQHYFYWERQAAGSHCGLHALNALLQGPCFTNHQLQSIAAHYEAEEANLVGKAPGENADPTGTIPYKASCMP